jgi:hypothetical protein
MHAKSTFLTVALSVVGAFSALAVDIQITYLPFNITAPGKYVLTSNLSYTAQYTPTTDNPGPRGLGYTPAIIISSDLNGPVILDLQGHSLSGPGYTTYSLAIAVGAFSGTQGGFFPITIKNGTIQKFGTGIYACPGDSVSPTVSRDIVGLEIDKMNFMLLWNSGAVHFQNVDSSSVKSCNFSETPKERLYPCFKALQYCASDDGCTRRSIEICRQLKAGRV